MRELRIQTPEGKAIFARLWTIPEPAARVQILHGVAEHSGRYSRLAGALNAAGFEVICHDQRGHGNSLEPSETPLDIETKLGLAMLVEDARVVGQWQLPDDRPLFTLGHSMGSLVACNTLQRYPRHAAGLVLSALPEHPPLLTSVAKGIGNIQSTLFGGASYARLHSSLSFDVWNKAFKPNRTRRDWISSVDAEVDDYLADPLCGGKICVSWYEVLLDLLGRAHDVRRWHADHSALPVFAVAGGDDPVVGKQDGFLKSMGRLKPALPQLEFHIYPGARHEVFNDHCRESVTAAIIDRLTDLLPGNRQLNAPSALPS